MADLSLLRPVNRHLLIVPHVKKNETSSGVLLPDDFQPDDDSYIEATVIDIAPDCNKQFRFLSRGHVDNNKIIVDKAMIREIKIKNNTHYMILENYVVGVYRRPDEH